MIDEKPKGQAHNEGDSGGTTWKILSDFIIEGDRSG